MNARHRKFPLRAPLVLFTLLFAFVSLASFQALAQSPETAPTQEPGQPHTGQLEPASVQPDQGAAPAVATVPDDAAQVDQFTKQGIVTLELEVSPERFRAGDTITYTYKYANTSNETVSGIRLDATWSNFSDRVGRNEQFCNPGPCEVLAGSVQGPTVIKDEDAGDNDQVPGGIKLLIGDLGPNEQGQFSIVIDTLNSLYPQINRAQQQVSGSGSLFINDEPSSISENSVDAFIIGPVFSLAKVIHDGLTSQDGIYPLETGTFTVTVGNAIGEDQTRADATAATNVVVRDELPNGSTFITPTSGVSIDNGVIRYTNGITQVFDAEEGEIVWTIPQMLVGEQRDLPVTFQKLDVAPTEDCRNLNNAVYSVSSDQMPLANQSNDQSANADRLVVKGRATRITVIVPLRVASIVAEPNRVQAGERSIITIKVANYFTQNVSNLQLVYNVQSDVVVDTTTIDPPPAQPVENPDNPGPQIIWNFNIAEGTKTTPTEIEFKLEVLAQPSTRDRGTALLVTDTMQPSDIPVNCLEPVRGGVSVGDPPPTDVEITKEVFIDGEWRTGGEHFISQGQELDYRISLKNLGEEDVLDLTLTDSFPTEFFADFVYLGSIGQEAGDPDQYIDDPAGRALIWRNIDLPPGDPLEFIYPVRAGGNEYVTYRNIATASTDQPNVRYTGSNSVRVKINPDIEVDILADKTAASPGEEIRLDLKLNNNTGQEYRVGLVNMLQQLEYIGPAADGTDYSNTQSLDTELNAVFGDEVALASGGRLDMSVRVRMPECTRDTFESEVKFSFRSPKTNFLGVVTPIPAVKVQITCIRNVIEYSQRSDREASLRSLMSYRLTLRNRNRIEPVTNVEVQHLLPPGFEFVTMATGGEFIEEPTAQPQPDGGVLLTWVVPSIAANATDRIEYLARTGATVGPKASSLRASAPTTPGFCTGTCVPDGDGVIWATTSVEVQALHTVEPFLGAECVTENVPMRYTVRLVNNNPLNDYTETTVAVTLPIGLRYALVYDGTDEPRRTTTQSGQTILTWDNILVAKATGRASTQRIFEVGLTLGQVVGDLTTSVQVSSPDGLILPKSRGEEKQVVSICESPTPQPVTLQINKEANPNPVIRGNFVVYQIELANYSDQALTVDIQDQLPSSDLSYITMVANTNNITASHLVEPTINGTTLAWTGITVPPAESETQPGLRYVNYRAQVALTMQPESYASSAQVTAVTPDIADNIASLNSSIRLDVVDPVYPIYLPIIQR